MDFADIGTVFAKGNGIYGIKSVKTDADVYSPVEGGVTALNENVKVDGPALVNNSAEGDGWILKVKVSKEQVLNEFMNETE